MNLILWTAMLLLIPMAFAQLSTSGGRRFNQPLMVNGEKVTGDEYPFIGALIKQYQNRDPYCYCTASLISCNPITFMTAAHCVDGIKKRKRGSYTHRDGNGNFNWFVDLCRTDGDASVMSDNCLQPFEITNWNEQIKIHDEWDTTNVGAGFDIALIQFSGQKLTTGCTIGHIPPKLELSDPCCVKDDSFLSIGYGLDEDYNQGGSSTPTLERISMTCQLASSPQCADLNQNLDVVKDLPNDQMCMLGTRADNHEDSQDICSGDSGGPLFKAHDGKFIIFGITSYASSFDDNFCNSDHVYTQPSFFTSTAHYRDWIDGHFQYPLPDASLPLPISTTPPPTDPIDPSQLAKDLAAAKLALSEAEEVLSGLMIEWDATFGFWRRKRERKQAKLEPLIEAAKVAVVEAQAAVDAAQKALDNLSSDNSSDAKLQSLQSAVAECEEECENCDEECKKAEIARDAARETLEKAKEKLANYQPNSEEQNEEANNEEDDEEDAKQKSGKPSKKKSKGSSSSSSKKEKKASSKQNVKASAKLRRRKKKSNKHMFVSM